MNKNLMMSISLGNPLVMDLFKEPFNSNVAWHDYFKKWYQNGVSIIPLLEYNAGLKKLPNQDYAKEVFRALLVACWVTHPLEKGSYMIPLSDKQKKSVLALYEMLNTRGSSHLQKDSASKGAKTAGGLPFINGYNELLIQVVKNTLFIKMEGYQTTGTDKVMHGLAYLKPMTANETLKKLAKDEYWGISPRAAENLEENYKKLLKGLDINHTKDHSKQTPVYLVMQTLYTKCRAVQGRTYIDFGTDDPGKLAAYIEQCIKLTDDASVGKNDPIWKLFVAAKKDFIPIIKGLKLDAAREKHDHEIPRIFGEVKLIPQDIDRAIRDFFDDYLINVGGINTLKSVLS